MTKFYCDRCGIEVSRKEIQSVGYRECCRPCSLLWKKIEKVINKFVSKKEKEFWR
jgi:hypothetical protein